MALYRRKVKAKDGTLTVSKVWTMSFVFNGQHISESTGMTSKVKAQLVYEKRKQELKEGAAGIKKQKQVHLLSVAAKEWQEVKEAKWSPKMKLIGKYALEHLLPEMGRKLLVDISASDIAKYQKVRLNEGASNRTINIEVGVLRQIMKKHGAWERVKASEDWKDVGMLKERKDAGRALTAAEESMLILECGRSASRSLLPFVVLLLETGARYNTIRTLQWGQIDFANRRLKIGKDKTEAGTGRKVPLSSRAIETLNLWASQFPERKPAHFVFPSESYGLHGEEGKFGGEVKVYEYNPAKSVGTIKTAWQSAKKRTQRHCPACNAGTLADREKPGQGYYCVDCNFEVEELPSCLKQLRLHDLRHSAVSRMVAARVPLTTIAKIVGWSDSTTVAMAARYSHPEETEMRAAVESISGLSEGLRQFPRHLESDYPANIN
jgi:integrase